MSNQLFYGHNLHVLRQHVETESVDLVYLDPPFNSNANYNIPFRSEAGECADANIRAFNDTWRWGPAAEDALADLEQGQHLALLGQLDALRKSVGPTALVAYLAMMSVRLIELRRVLKPTGSLYLHCDPTASHYLKMMLDFIFGITNFRNEISWRRSSAHNDAKQGRSQYGNVRDTILFYSKSGDWTWNTIHTAYDSRYVDTAYRHRDPDGRRYRRGDLTAAKAGGDVSYGWPVKRPVGGVWQADLDGEGRTAAAGWEYKTVYPYKGRYWAFSRANMTAFAQADRLVYAASGMPEYKRYLDEQCGVALQNDWNDVAPVTGRERLGYPTQKPLALLERIIAASSRTGDIVLDPFCGCGTAVDAAQKLDRAWIGIDVTHLAIGLIEKRLRDSYGSAAHFETIGVPHDLASARRLAREEPHEFQTWITLKLGGRPTNIGRKGGDRGIDGYVRYLGDGRRAETGVLSVKAGHNLNPGMVRDLRGVMQRDGHDIGILICAERPTRGMLTEAQGYGSVELALGRFPVIQIFTLAELFDGRRPNLPPILSPGQSAGRVDLRASHQPDAQASLL